MDSRVNIIKTDILFNERSLLREIHFEYRKKNGETEQLSRQVFDHGNAVTVLLFNREKRSVILTRQFRMASYVNGNTSGFLLECCAGMLEEESPEEAIKREIKEETGYDVTEVKKVMEIYTSPGVYTELLHFFTAAYTPAQKTDEGGGLEDEQEEIDVVEMPFDTAMKMIGTGEIKDAKTIILLQYAKINALL